MNRDRIKARESNTITITVDGESLSFRYRKSAITPYTLKQGDLESLAYLLADALSWWDMEENGEPVEIVLKDDRMEEQVNQYDEEGSELPEHLQRYKEKRITFINYLLDLDIDILNAVIKAVGESLNPEGKSGNQSQHSGIGSRARGRGKLVQ